MESDRHINYDGYPMVDLESDDGDNDNQTSSEDEIDILLSGSHKRQLKNQNLEEKSSSSEDEFEKEMAAELDQRMMSIANMHTGKKSLSADKKRKTAQQKYEDDFLDSIDRSDDEDVGGQENKTKEPSNDDLLYDPDMDEEDQKWVDKQRRMCQSQSVSKVSKPLTTDAVLSCPACMICLCRDCQRHSVYKNQFRAMFVTNCSVNKSEIMRYPIQGSKKKKAKVKRNDGSTPADSNNVAEKSFDEIYHPVTCVQCTTEVGVFDSDEIFHFFNVIESNG